MAEWLRRETRNLLGSSRAGLNPAVVEFFPLSSLTTTDCKYSNLRIRKKDKGKLIIFLLEYFKEGGFLLTKYDQLFTIFHIRQQPLQHPLFEIRNS